MGKGVSRTWFAAVVAVLVVSVICNVLLAHKVQKLNAVAASKVAAGLLKLGTTVPPISAKLLDGRPATLTYGSEMPTVLYVFTPPCSWCARNLDNFRTLLDRDKGQYRIVGLSLSQEGLGEYVANNGLELPVYSGLSDDTKKSYKLSGTPQTIVVSPEGKVLRNWMGAYVGKQKDEIEAYFHVKLPGLRDFPNKPAKDNRLKATD